eukprot:m.61946 g.61946  ORF g.61946 m.61946 type:complete len:417 (+) comp49513_c0_seq2:220-1470(+)
MSMFDELLASEVKYCGFVYIDSTDERPTLYHANVAAMMFDKKQLKATRALNPLFALENDKSLEMIVIQESLKMFAKKEGQTILEVPIRKLVFVAAQEKYIYVIADRSGAGKYYCHRFKLKNSTLSAEVSKRLTEVILQANGQPSRLPVDLDDQDDFEAKFGGDATAMHFSGLAVDVDSDDEEPVDDEADADVHIPIHRMLSTHRRPTVTAVSSRSYEVPVPSPPLHDDSGGLYSELPVTIHPAASTRRSADNFIPPSGVVMRTASHGDQPSGFRSQSVSSRRELPPLPRTSSMSSSEPVVFRAADYYFDSLPRRDAERRLEGQRSGTFLVRRAESHEGWAISLVLQSGVLQHFKLWQDADNFFRIAGNERRPFESMSSLIEHYRQASITPDGDFLLRPCPRLTSDPHVYETTVAES